MLVGLGLVAVAAVVSLRLGLGVERELVVAVVRALVQLGVVALIITAVFNHLGLSAGFVAVMLAAAAITSGRRIQGVGHPMARAAAAIALAAAVAVVPLFAVGAFPLTPRYVIPVSGIVIGGAMKATSLAGLRLIEELSDHHQELEARLALGVSAMTALRWRLRRAVVAALVPAIDQTKNVGLVTLPGAFVGMLLGGSSPLEAAVVQLTVLFALLGAGALAAAMATLLIARAAIQPGERIQLPVAR
jgi:putative ABC transport system permease protein